MTEKKRIEDLKKIFLELDCIVPTIDRIGSIEETERTALALLLYFKEEKVLDKLSGIRKIVDLELQQLLSKEQFDEFIEQDVAKWKPPYQATQEDLLNMIKEI